MRNNGLSAHLACIVDRRLVDGYLARSLPALLRAFLTAAFGMTIAIGGALCTGVCSLLSNDYGHRHRLALPNAAE